MLTANDMLKMLQGVLPKKRFSVFREKAIRQGEMLVFMFHSDEGPSLETLDLFVEYFGSAPTL